MYWTRVRPYGINTCLIYDSVLIRSIIDNESCLGIISDLWCLSLTDCLIMWIPCRTRFPISTLGNIDEFIRTHLLWSNAMGLLPDTQNCGLRIRRECRERFPRHRGFAILTYITARAWCKPGSLTSSFLSSRWRGENVPGIPGACATRNFAHLVRGP